MVEPHSSSSGGAGLVKPASCSVRGAEAYALHCLVLAVGIVACMDKRGALHCKSSELFCWFLQAKIGGIEALTSDCILVKAATPEQRLRWLHAMAATSGSDKRKRYALERLAGAEVILPKEY